MNLFKSKPDPRTQRENISPAHRCLYLSVESLRAFVKTGEHAMTLAASSAEALGPNIWSSGNYARSFFGVGDSRLIEARAALQILQESPEYREAAQIVEPILLAVAALEQAEEIARQEKQAKLSALTQAQETALAAARLKAESDPAVIAARRALEALNAV